MHMHVDWLRFMVFNAILTIFQYIVAVSFIGGEARVPGAACQEI